MSDKILEKDPVSGTINNTAQNMLLTVYLVLKLVGNGYRAYAKLDRLPCGFVYCIVHCYNRMNKLHVIML